MSDRLRPGDLALLARESATSPLHSATLEIFEPGEAGLDPSSLVRLIADRIAFVPRYRQRLRWVPGRLANPVWVDDPGFDLAYHVRRCALPAPGSMDQLRALVARVVSCPLDRTRPLWETYLVEGLAGGRVAMLSKAHLTLVDGLETVDLGQVLLDTDPEPRELDRDPWQPRPDPSPTALVADAVLHSVTSPTTVAATVRGNAESALRLAEGAVRRARSAVGALTGRSLAASPLHRPLSPHRRLVTVRMDLAEHRRVHRVHGGSVNDVILAVITGGLRGLMTRRESLYGLRQMHALVPMSVTDDDPNAASLGTQIAGLLVDLPIGEPSPVVRLLQVSQAFTGRPQTGRAVAANRLAGIAGFAPTTFHALGSRLGVEELRRGDHLTITNMPGPQFPLYAAGARIVETYPVPPLPPGHTLAIGVTSYGGGVHYGVTADHDAVPDADMLGQCLSEALEELVESARVARPRTSPRRTTQGPRP
jgi:diacylglycerol O-acyltransferase